jgi:D-proline reductase (dithiol) PrdB
MPRLARLSQIARNNLLTFPAQVNETAPFVRPAKPLAACRLAIVTTAGLHRRGDRLFTPGDQTYRVIASNTPTVDIIQSHTSIGSIACRRCATSTSRSRSIACAS